mmetsp:Transcript_42824/g.91045  ORF Transcript_42824/g.91045 Transcript_42824/m.91045 type:complete len:253 (-) Transcript_42824:152-910(-)
MVTFLDDFKRIMLVHELFVQSKDIWWLPIWNFVRAKPFTYGRQSAWKEFLNIINVIEERCPFVLSINRNNLPVGFALVNHAENAKNFGWADFSSSNNPRTNFAHIHWIVVASATLRIRVDKCWIFPCTRKAPIVEENIPFLELTQNTLLFVLLDKIAHFVSGNFVFLPRKFRNFAHKVEVGRRPISGRVHMHQGHVMPQRNRLLSAFVGCLNAVLCGVFIAVRVKLEVRSRPMGRSRSRAERLSATDRHFCY